MALPLLSVGFHPVFLSGTSNSGEKHPCAEAAFCWPASQAVAGVISVGQVTPQKPPSLLLGRACGKETSV